MHPRIKILRIENDFTDNRDERKFCQQPETYIQGKGNKYTEISLPYYFEPGHPFGITEFPIDLEQRDNYSKYNFAHLATMPNVILRISAYLVSAPKIWVRGIKISF